MARPSEAAIHAALASQPRRRVLSTVAASAEAVSAQLVADQLRMHITTARFHLEQLESAGLVARHPEPLAHTGRRGRPRMLFTAVDPHRDERARQQLLTVLADALQHAGATSPGESAELAGRKWAKSLAVDIATGTNPDAAHNTAAGTASSTSPAPAHPRAFPSPTLLSVLTELGFDPVISSSASDSSSPEGSDSEESSDTVQLRSCPFQEAATLNPAVVCSVHRGLVDELLSAESREAGVRLLPVIQPGVCVIGRPKTVA